MKLTLWRAFRPVETDCAFQMCRTTSTDASADEASPATSPSTDDGTDYDLDISASQLIDPGTGAPIIGATSSSEDYSTVESPSASPTSSRKLK